MISLIAFTFLTGLSLEEEILKSKIKIESLQELHDQEVGSLAELPLDFEVSEKAFLACVPRESSPFPTKLSPELAEKVFTKDEMEGLMSCHSDDCKFNFLPSEIPSLERTKSPAERQMLFFKFYEDRTKGLKGIDPHRSALFLRSRDHAFEDCEGPEFQNLLNERPLKNHGFRLSFAKYNKQMRPTLRLAQGISFRSEKSFCYAEALIFSDHYDVDRIEVWSLKTDSAKSTLKFQLRHRIDLLNTWMRRLNKQKFRNESREIAFKQMSEVEACLKAPAKVSVSPQAKPTEMPKTKLLTPKKK